MLLRNPDLVVGPCPLTSVLGTVWGLAITFRVDFIKFSSYCRKTENLATHVFVEPLECALLRGAEINYL